MSHKTKRLTLRDLFIGLLAGFFLFLIFQWPYFDARIDYWNNKMIDAGTETQVIINKALELPPNTIYIPSIQIEAPLVYIDNHDESSIQEALKDGVVHYSETVRPGEPGNSYFVGHSSDLLWNEGDFKTIFALLPRVQKEERFYVSDGAEKLMTFKVIDTKIVLPTDLSVLDQGDYTRKLITLQTSYPLGTALKRFLVIAELESVR